MAAYILNLSTKLRYSNKTKWIAVLHNAAVTIASSYISVYMVSTYNCDQAIFSSIQSIFFRTI